MERPQGSKTHDKDEYHDLVYEGHLGGCSLTGDGATYYPMMWKRLIEKYDIKSMIDVGCGRGFSADYFKDLGVKVLGVEGCTGAIEKSFLPPEMIVKHDYEKDGPYIPEEEFDLCWSCEFVEHVDAGSAPNFLATFQKAKYVAITFAYPGQGGHHHVNEQHAPYWIDALHKVGFNYLHEDTEELRVHARKDGAKYSPYYESHFISKGLFFKRVD